MNIAGRPIGDGHPPFLIGECSINHNGSIIAAVKMIHAARDAGCHAVKFQSFRAEDVCSPDQLYTYRSQGKEITEHRIDIFRRCELPDEVWPMLKEECERTGLLFMSTPETPRDLDMLLRVGVPAIKIGSDNLTNGPMLRAVARDDVNLPVILSCGMSDLAEVTAALLIVGTKNTALLVCTSIYPTPPAEANLARITNLRNICPTVPIGFSDHSTGSHAAVMATTLGACIIETHLTLSHDMPGPEHDWARTPAELSQWADDIRQAHAMMGDGIVAPGKVESRNKAEYQRIA